MFTIPVQEQDEIVNVISGVVMPRHSPLMTRQNCKSSPGQMREMIRREMTHLTGKNESRPLFLTHCRYDDKSFIYSASMKSYHFWNFDILKIIKGIWTVTLHFVFLVNTPRAIKPFSKPCNWGTAAARAFCAFHGLSKCENIIFKNKYASVCLKNIPWKRHWNGFDYSIKYSKTGSDFQEPPPLGKFP